MQLSKKSLKKWPLMNRRNWRSWKKSNWCWANLHCLVPRCRKLKDVPCGADCPRGPGWQEIAQAIWTSKSNDLEEHSQGWTCSCWVAGSCKIGEMSSMWRHQTKTTRPSCWTENWVWVQCVGIDVAECKDYAGNKYSVMSMVDISAGFHVARVVKEGGTMPTSESCAKALMEGWISWAGWPKMVTMDRG